MSLLVLYLNTRAKLVFEYKVRAFSILYEFIVSKKLTVEKEAFALALTEFDAQSLPPCIADDRRKST